MAEQIIDIRKDLFDIKKNIYSNADAIKLSTAISKSDSEALFYMALTFFWGENQSQDYKQSYEWATKAADRNHARAQCLLGICRAMGLGIDQNTTVMLYWLHKSSEFRDVGGLYCLAQCYEKGWGIPQNLQTALYFYAEAANLGDAVSKKKAKELTEVIDDANKEYTAEDIEQWFEKGEEYYFGDEETEPNYKEAIKWYRKAAKAGHADAQFSLGYCYLNGQGVATDEEVACKWLKKATEQKHPEAMYNLGTCFEQGLGVPIDIEKALSLYTEAKQLGYADANEAIGQLNRSIAAYKVYFEKIGIIPEPFFAQLTCEERKQYEELEGSVKAEFDYYRKEHPNWNFKTLYDMSTSISRMIGSTFVEGMSHPIPKDQSKESGTKVGYMTSVTIPPTDLEKLTPEHRAMYEKARQRHPDWTHEQCLYYGYNLIK